MRTRMRQRRKMLASTIQFSHNTPTPQQPHTTNSAVIIHVQANKTTTTTHNANAVRRPCAAPDTQQHANIPKTMFAENWSHTRATQSRSIQPCRCASTRKFIQNKKVAVTPTATSTTNPQPWAQKQKLLRKEVIQPHLPVRLPCYDFVPIADPTFDHSLTSLGHGLRVLPTFMT